MNSTYYHKLAEGRCKGMHRHTQIHFMLVVLLFVISTRQVAALFYMKSHHFRHLESVTSNQNSDSFN